MPDRFGGVDAIAGPYEVATALGMRRPLDQQTFEDVVRLVVSRVTPETLVDHAGRLATTVDPPARLVECSLEDYKAARLPGSETFIAIKPSLSARSGDISMGDRYWEAIHVHRVELRPNEFIDRGVIRLG